MTSEYISDAIPYLSMDCSKQNQNDNIIGIAFIKKSDCVLDDKGHIVRMKKKYGNLKREIIKAPIK